MYCIRYVLYTVCIVYCMYCILYVLYTVPPFHGGNLRGKSSTKKNDKPPLIFTYLCEYTPPLICTYLCEYLN